MFNMELVRPRPNGEVWVTLRDDHPRPDVGAMLQDEDGAIWRVVGHTPSEVKLRSDQEGLEPQGAVLCLANVVALRSASAG